MTTTKLVVYRPKVSWRADRGRPDVHIDGRVRERLAAGKQLEFDLNPGRHTVQVGRNTPVQGQMIFVGSPPLSVDVTDQVGITVRVDPSGVPLRVQITTPQSTFRLTAEGRNGTTTQIPQPLEPGLPPGVRFSAFARGAATKPQPLRSWQAIVSALLVVYAVVQVVLVSLAHHVRPGQWAWTAFVVASSVLTLIGWVSLLHHRPAARKGVDRAG